MTVAGISRANEAAAQRVKEQTACKFLYYCTMFLLLTALQSSPAHRYRYSRKYRVMSLRRMIPVPMPWNFPCRSLEDTSKKEGMMSGRRLRTLSSRRLSVMW